MKIAMIAPPWLPIPPNGYGGIENVIAALVPALMDLGAEVELFTVGETTLQSNKNHWLYSTGQYKHIHDPMLHALPIIIAHTMYALNKIRDAGDFDVIHSHVDYIDAFAALNPEDLPPIVHTLHGPPFTTPDRLSLNLPDNIPMYQQLVRAKNLYIVGISKALLQHAPRALRPLLLRPVYNAVNPDLFPYVTEKSDYFITLARFNRDKGQGIAIRACMQLGYRLKMAGGVGTLMRPKQVMMELANPLSSYRSLDDFRYFSDEVFPYLEPGEIEFVGDLAGQNKLDFISHARALLFPIQWEEPFGMAAIEALACGTPVIAMAHGALTEIIEHGVNGFLANSEEEFTEYMQRIDKIDPAACRQSVEDRFSDHAMAKQYLHRFETAIQKRNEQLVARQYAIRRPYPASPTVGGNLR